MHGNRAETGPGMALCDMQGSLHIPGMHYTMSMSGAAAWVARTARTHDSRQADGLHV